MILNAITAIPTEQILYLESDENYTWVYLTNGKKLLSARTLKLYETHFTAHHFVRIHRTYLVNPQHVVSYRETVQLSDGTTLAPSRRRMSSARRQLSAWRYAQH